MSLTVARLMAGFTLQRKFRIQLCDGFLSLWGSFDSARMTKCLVRPDDAADLSRGRGLPAGLLVLDYIEILQT